jgi:hypothetical protein
MGRAYVKTVSENLPSAKIIFERLSEISDNVSHVTMADVNTLSTADMNAGDISITTSLIFFGSPPCFTRSSLKASIVYESLPGTQIKDSVYPYL